MRRYIPILFVCAVLSFSVHAEELDPNKVCVKSANWESYDCHPYPQECYRMCHGGLACAIPAKEFCYNGPNPTLCFCDFAHREGNGK